MQKLSTQSWFKALSRNALFDFQFECQETWNPDFNQEKYDFDTKLIKFQNKYYLECQQKYHLCNIAG